MTAAVAFLRAVNVGGTGKIAMADLKALAAAIGLGDPRTLLQSGNLVFEAGAKSPATLETLLEKEVEARLGLKTVFMVRTAKEMKQILARNPFPAEAKNDPARLHVYFLKAAATASAVAALNAAIKGPETAKGKGREIVISFPDGMGNSKLTHAMIEKHLGTRVTARNWNTVGKLAEMT
jgi:uncharacterized protein (DUF1697 family)